MRTANDLPWFDEHPFLTFSADTRKLPVETWALLGECSSKLDHMRGIPLKPKIQDRLSQVYLARGAHGTTAIEGNTLSQDDVEKRISGKLELPDSLEYQGAAIDNVVRSYNAIVSCLANEKTIPFCEDEIRALNRSVLEGLPVDEGVIPGEYRTGVVGVNRYRSPERKYLAQQMHMLCNFINEPWPDTDRFPHMVVPILKAIYGHLFFAWVHPFGDGNGRTARLIEFDILTRHGAPPLCAHVLSDYYNRTRPEYYQALEAARRGSEHFVAYAVRGLAEGLREQLKVVIRQQVNVAWESFVYDTFRRLPSTEPNRRRQMLAVFLGERARKMDLRRMALLGSKLNALYGGEQRKLLRDASFLEKIGLVTRAGPYAVANTELITSFIPFNRKAKAAVERAPVTPQP